MLPPPTHTRTLRVFQVLVRRTKNNPVLLGESGVGKTALVEGEAARGAGLPPLGGGGGLGGGLVAYQGWGWVHSGCAHHQWTCTQRRNAERRGRSSCGRRHHRQWRGRHLNLHLTPLLVPRPRWRRRCRRPAGLAQRIASGDCPQPLKGAAIVALDMGSIMAGESPGLPLHGAGHLASRCGRVRSCSVCRHRCRWAVLWWRGVGRCGRACATSPHPPWVPTPLSTPTPPQAPPSRASLSSA